MPIPPFDSRGLIPPFVGTDATTANRSPYDATIVELVTQFATTPRRKQLLRNLLAYRAVLASGGYSDGVQMLDGSFVENVEATSGREPGDIDVLSLLIMPAAFSDRTVWTSVGFPFWVSEVANQPLNKTRFQLDTYALPYPPASIGGVRDLFYWHSLFGHQRVTMAWKGFVMVRLDTAADATAMGLL